MHAKGIQRTPQGWRAYVRVKGFPLKCKRFKADEPIEQIKEWREEQRAKLIVKRKEKAPIVSSGTFADDARAYLAAVTAMPTYKERVQHIREWAALFGEQLTATITAVQIRTQRDTWLTVGPRTVYRKGKRVQLQLPLAPNTANKRLRALENLFTVLYPGQPNPVRQVPEAEEREGVIRAIPAGVVARIFAKMHPSPTKARLLVLRWTGLPAKSLMRLEAEDVDLRKRIMVLAGRQKGKGTKGRIMPLLPQAVAAFRELKREHAWGSFSTSAMYRAFKLACEKAGVKGVTPYDLRHTFGTEFLAATGDLRATQRALDHSTPTLTERYSRAALDPALAAAFRVRAKVGESRR